MMSNGILNRFGILLTLIMYGLLNKIMESKRVEYPNGIVMYQDIWYNLHRTDGPAVECPNGHQEWWVNGKLHRFNGPAIISANGEKDWYLRGKRVKESDVKFLNDYLFVITD
jgi:hypothetical protein